MSTILTNARLINPETETEHLGTLAFEDGVITRVTRDVTDVARSIDCKGLCLAPGIVDIGVKIGEPGERHKESFRSAGAAAAAGGITTMVIRPDTTPAVDSPEILEFVHRRAKADAPVRILPMAALTKGRAGTEMAEIGFLQDAGALAFSDADAVLKDTKVLSRCLTYAKGMEALIIGHPQEPSLSAGASATSGKLASKLGLPSVSAMAERIELDRLLALVEMTGVRFHFDQITTQSGLRAFVRGKEKGLPVTAGCSIHHLTLNAYDIEGYRTFFKVKPPLREEEDRLAMVEAVARGQIDIVSSMHTPQDEESKRLPFQEAASGAIGLETFLPAMMRLVHAGAITLPKLWRSMSLNPSALLKLPTGRLSEGAPADLVLFDPDAPFVLDRFTLRSKSKNTPFDGQRLQGRVYGTWINGEKIFDAAN
ncbi:MAG: dihydroorotase [Pseudomonadota bacterium]